MEKAKQKSKSLVLAHRWKSNMNRCPCIQVCTNKTVACLCGIHYCIFGLWKCGEHAFPISTNAFPFPIVFWGGLYFTCITYPWSNTGLKNCMFSKGTQISCAYWSAIYTHVTWFPLEQTLVLPTSASGCADALLHLLHLGFLLILCGGLCGLGNPNPGSHVFNNTLSTLASDIHKMGFPQKSWVHNIWAVAVDIMHKNTNISILTFTPFSNQLFLTQTHSHGCIFFTSSMLANFILFHWFKSFSQFFPLFHLHLCTASCNPTILFLPI